MRQNDIEMVVAIERNNFEHPWSLNQFQDEFKKVNSHRLIIELNGLIVGYLLAWDILGEIEIGVISISEEFNKKGYAQSLLNHLFEGISSKLFCFLEVRESNESAIRFYQQYGFKQISIRKKYYRDGSDAVIMKKTF